MVRVRVRVKVRVRVRVVRVRVKIGLCGLPHSLRQHVESTGYR